MREIVNPNGKTTSLYSVEAANEYNSYVRRTTYALSGTTITPSNAGYFKTAGTAITESVAGSYIKILAVYGYTTL